jgi:hypothetical protein
VLAQQVCFWDKHNFTIKGFQNPFFVCVEWDLKTKPHVLPGESRMQAHLCSGLKDDSGPQHNIQ